MKNFIFCLILFFILILPLQSYLHLGGVETESNIVLSKDMVLWTVGFRYLTDIKYQFRYDKNLIEEQFDVIRVPILLKYGLSNKIELQGGITFNSQTSDMNSSPRGIEHIFVGARFRLNQLLTNKIYAKLSGNNKLYYSIDEIAVGTEIQTTIRLLNGSVTANVGYINRNGNFLIEQPPDFPPLSEKFENSVYQSVVYNYPINPDLNLFFEYVNHSRSIENAYKNVFLNAGFKYEVADEVELILFATKGLEDGAPDLGINFMFNKYFGYSFYTADGVDIRTRHISTPDDLITRVPTGIPSQKDAIRDVKYKDEIKQDTKKLDSERAEAPLPTQDEDIVLSSILEKIRELETRGKDHKTEKPDTRERIDIHRVQPDTIYCPNCGEILPADAVFCPHCGHEIKRPKEKEPIEIEHAFLSPDAAFRFDRSMERGRIDFANNRYDRAAHHFREALRIHPTSVSALYNIGVAHFYAREYRQARQYFEQAISLNPTDVDSLNFLAWIYHIQGDIQKAINTYKRTLEIEPGNPVARANLERLGIYK